MKLVADINGWTESRPNEKGIYLLLVGETAELMELYRADESTPLMMRPLLDVGDDRWPERMDKRTDHDELWSGPLWGLKLRAGGNA
ncbi:MAG: hypothetical protein Q8K86_08360 [Candidatus Nanopelagicaceae bacterium]|nr:hypothetical protein [Candidatus Nanopelagicaceae bacterium]